MTISLVIPMKLTEAKLILETVQTRNIDLTEEGTVKKIKKAKSVFVSHYKGNPQSFIEDYIEILHGVTNEVVPFRFNEAQQLLVDQLDQRWLAAPKARQLGITTLTNALALHHAIFVNNANVICMAVKTENAQENLRRIKTMFKSMPEWVQKTVLKWDDKQGHLNNQSLWSFKSLITSSQNKIEVASASSEDATRGKTPTFLHWTEVAFSDIAEQIFTSVFPALNRRKDSIIVLESTGNGAQGFYYEICTGQKKGFAVVFMPWYLDGNYVKPVDDKLDLEYVRDLMGVEELPELSEEQFQWYQDTSETIGKAKCQQEYPLNVEQVFQATSNSFFSSKVNNGIDIREPIAELVLKGGLLTHKEHGSGKVFEAPDDDFEYILSCDPSAGVEDPTHITVFSPDGHEVAYWSEYIDPDQVVDIVNALGKYYNDALVIVERNGIGQYVLQRLQQSKLYPNLHTDAGKLGIATTVASKEPMLATLQSKMIEQKLIFHNPVIQQEIPTFRADTKKAEKGKHDDAIMASAILAWVFHKNPPLRRVHYDSYREYGYDNGIRQKNLIC